LKIPARLTCLPSSRDLRRYRSVARAFPIRRPSAASAGNAGTDREVHSLAASREVPVNAHSAVRAILEQPRPLTAEADRREYLQLLRAAIDRSESKPGPRRPRPM